VDLRFLVTGRIKTCLIVTHGNIPCCMKARCINRILCLEVIEWNFQVSQFIVLMQTTNLGIWILVLFKTRAVMSPLHLVLLQTECIYVGRRNEYVFTNTKHIRLYLTTIRVISLTKRRARIRRNGPWSRALCESDTKPTGKRGCRTPKAFRFNKSNEFSPYPHCL
jgi:hypothetical protein